MSNESTKVHGVTRKHASIHIHSREILKSHAVTHYDLCHFDREDGGNTLLRNICTYLPNYTVIYPLPS